jgi:MYXO-CTERM domain-containing protein
VRDLLITGTPGAKTEICKVTPVPVDAGADAPVGCDPFIEAVSLSPWTGSGASGLFETRFRHCMGADAFRIVQLWVGDSVGVGVPSVNLAYEAGQFHLEGKSCSPGESVVLSTALGSLDCALSKVQLSGNDLVTTWAVNFDTTAFAGTRGVFVDAKGPASVSPEPRLGWTWMGSFVVTSADGGATPAIDGSAGTTASPPDESANDGLFGDCGCKLVRRDGPGSGTALAWLAALALLARRRRSASLTS